MKNILNVLMLLLCISALFSCTKEPEPIKVESVTLNAESLTLIEGETTQILATVSPNNADNQKVIWTSSNVSVVSVNGGVVTAIKEGSAIITATSDDGGKTATCQVEVKSKVIAVESVTLNRTSAELTEGDELTLTATVKPDNATNKNVIWSSSNETVVTVDGDGKITAIKEGTANIIVKSEYGGITATCAVTVKIRTNDSDGSNEDFYEVEFDWEG